MISNLKVLNVVSCQEQLRCIYISYLAADTVPSGPGFYFSFLGSMYKKVNHQGPFATMEECEQAAREEAQLAGHQLV